MAGTTTIAANVTASATTGIVAIPASRLYILTVGATGDGAATIQATVDGNYWFTPTTTSVYGAGGVNTYRITDTPATGMRLVITVTTGRVDATLLST